MRVQSESSYNIRPLDASTWDAFAELLYVQLKGWVGHAKAVVVPWSLGQDLPPEAVIPSLRRWQQEVNARARSTSALLGSGQPRALRYARDISDGLKRQNRGLGALLLSEAKLRQVESTDDVDPAFYGGPGDVEDRFTSRLERPRIDSLRAEVMADSMLATTEGHETAANVWQAYTERLGSPPDLQILGEGVESIGGFTSIADNLALLDGIEAGEFPFERLVEWRDELLRTLLYDLPAIAAEFPSVAPVLEVVAGDAFLFTQVVAREAMGSAAIEWLGRSSHLNQGVASGTQ